MTHTTFSPETIDRIKKLERIKALGINPFATKFDSTSRIDGITKNYIPKLEEGEVSPFRDIETIIPEPKSSVRIAGRVLLHRSFGKICFATISDGTAKMQLLFSRENCSITSND
jgi:lysyl-tRNA synthetase class 2